MKRVVYPGSFDPITFGHLDVIERASKTYDELIVGVLINPDKDPMFTQEERIDLINESIKHLQNVRVLSFSGLLVNFMKEHDIHAIVRGLRNAEDFLKEHQMAELNRRLYEKAETYFVMTDIKYAIVSSSMVKGLAGFRGPIHDFVPPHVEIAIQTKINEKGAK